ncbi:MAG: elongation factor G, partial [Oscillospiraceae bacterium]|nr:elongation factor G [Oscillospiraceae bacterium]
MSYTAKDIRNIALLGHGGDGKTILAENMLFLTKGTDRMGKIADGNTVSDFDAEEAKRQYSISTSVLPVEWNKCKINVLDNPGTFDFAGEIAQSLRVADVGVICLTAKSGIEVGTEKGWKSLKKADLPAAFYVSKLDEEHANFFKTYDSLREQFGVSVVPFVFPIVEGDKTVGLVDVLSKTAKKTDGSKMDLSPDAQAKIDEYTAMLNEQIAETDEALMEKVLMEEPLTADELKKGLHDAIAQRSLTPVFCGSALAGYGTAELMDGVVNYFPNPLSGKTMPTADGGEFALNESGDPMVFVFKTLSDQFGKNSFFKVISGTVKSDMTLTNARTGDAEKLGNMFFPKGKNNTKTDAIACGDIGVFTKLSSVKTGDTLGLPGKTTAIAGIEFDTPCYAMAVHAKVKGQEDKIASGLTRLNEEDNSFTVENNAETKEMILSGVGDIHLGVICAKLLGRFKVEAELTPAKIAYRETIKKTVEQQGRHKKQSGGHGQFGDVYIRFSHQDETEDMIFTDETVGGCVPKNFIPSVEKGLRNVIKKGVLAGYPMVNLKATLYFGSSHPVDSSDMAFQTAAGIAYKEGIPKAA